MAQDVNVTVKRRLDAEAETFQPGATRSLPTADLKRLEGSGSVAAQRPAKAK